MSPTATPDDDHPTPENERHDGSNDMDLNESSQPNDKDAALEAALRGGLDERAATAVPPIDGWSRIEARRASSASGRGRAMGLSMLAAAAAIVVILGVVLVTRDNDTKLDTQGPAASSSTSSSTTSTTTALAAPVGTDPAPTSTTAAPTVGDAANATYPVTVCAPGLRPEGVTEFTLIQGKWGRSKADEPPYDPNRTWGVELEASMTGDVNGDAVEDHVITISCFPVGTDGIPNAVAVVDLVDGKATVLATLFESGTHPMGNFTHAPDAASAPITDHRPLTEYAKDVRVTNDGVVVKWDQMTMGGEDDVQYRSAVVTYALHGSQLDIVGQPVLSSTPRPAGTLLPKDRYAIRNANLRSVTLPLAMGERDPNQFVCHDFFGAPPEEMVDAQLVNGAANVTDTTGSPLIDHATGLPRNATVKIDQVFYGDFTGDGPEEAMVVIRCGTDAEAYRVPVVFHLVNGQPQVLEVISNPPEWKSARDVSIDQSTSTDRLKVVWGFDPSFHPDQPNTTTTVLRWDGAHFVFA
jgi:hypothetical protein